MNGKIVVLIILLVMAISLTAFPCTMVMLSKNGKALAGNNEDWKNPNTFMWFFPASEGRFGRVCVGFDMPYGFTQGGMNDQGLFIDGNALSPTGWTVDKQKKAYAAPIMDYILAHCATVDDVIKVFETYNIPALARAKFPVADAKGDTLVVEWGQGKVQCIKNPDWYQISTNFVQTDFADEKDYPCDRYRIAKAIIEDADEASIDVVRAVLSATHAEFYYPTVYSNIYDLKERKMYLYNFHNFEEVVVIDLAQELAKGKHHYAIPSLFKVKTQAARLFDYYSAENK